MNLNKLEGHRTAAIIIGCIVALADMVIVFDLWLAGSWLSSPFLSATKTAAFVAIFIGSLIAEMQQLNRSTRWLLFLCVVILGGYQAVVNTVVNYHGAAIPQTAADFFTLLAMTETQVKFGYAIADAFVRTTIVIIMWLVTGLVWRGAAVAYRQEKMEKAEEDTVVELSEYADWADRDADARRDRIIQFVADHGPDGISVSDVWDAVWNGREGSQSSKYRDISILVEEGRLRKVNGSDNSRIALPVREAGAF